MNPWIRLYRTSLHNPKIVMLNDRQHRVWHNCLLMADDAGGLPKMRDMACHMRMTAQETEQVLCELVECGLVDIEGMGPARSFRMHDWNVHQYVSDSSTERVKKFRNKNKAKKPETAMKRFSNDSVTVPDTDTDTDTERKSPPVRPQAEDETVKAETPPKTTTKASDIDAGFEAWARVASDYGLPACKSVSETRRKRMAKRLKVAGGPEAFEAVLRKEISGSRFLRGKRPPKPGTSKPFKADVDFILQDASWDRLVDGFYADAPGTPSAAPTSPGGPSGGVRGAQPEVYVHPMAEDAACAGMTLEEYRAHIERLRAAGKVRKGPAIHSAGQYKLDCFEQIGDASKSHGGRT